MALNLKRLNKAASDPTAETPPKRAAARTEPQERPFDFTYGRGVEPPPQGSSWGAFEDWACEGGWPTDADKRLALSAWMGKLRWREPEHTSAPAPR